VFAVVGKGSSLVRLGCNESILSGTYQSFQQATVSGMLFDNHLSEQVASNLEQILFITIYIYCNMLLKTNPLDMRRTGAWMLNQLATLGQDPNPRSQTHNLFTISKIALSIWVRQDNRQGWTLRFLLTSHFGYWFSKVTSHSAFSLATILTSIP